MRLLASRVAWLLSLGGALLGPGRAPAQDIHAEMTKLVLQDADKREAERAISRPQMTAAPAPADAAAEADDAVRLPAYVVHAAGIPLVHLPHYETPFMRILETGVFFRQSGRKATALLDFSPARDASGGGKLQVKFHILF